MVLIGMFLLVFGRAVAGGYLGCLARETMDREVPLLTVTMEAIAMSLPIFLVLLPATSKISLAVMRSRLVLSGPRLKLTLMIR